MGYVKIKFITFKKPISHFSFGDFYVSLLKVAVCNFLSLSTPRKGHFSPFSPALPPPLGGRHMFMTPNVSNCLELDSEMSV